MRMRFLGIKLLLQCIGIVLVTSCSVFADSYEEAEKYMAQGNSDRARSILLELARRAQAEESVTRRMHVPQKNNSYGAGVDYSMPPPRQFDYSQPSSRQFIPGANQPESSEASELIKQNEKIEQAVVDSEVEKNASSVDEVKADSAPEKFSLLGRTICIFIPLYFFFMLIFAAFARVTVYEDHEDFFCTLGFFALLLYVIIRNHEADSNWFLLDVIPISVFACYLLYRSFIQTRRSNPRWGSVVFPAKCVFVFLVPLWCAAMFGYFLLDMNQHQGYKARPRTGVGPAAAILAFSFIFYRIWKFVFINGDRVSFRRERSAAYRGAFDDSEWEADDMDYVQVG